MKPLKNSIQTLFLALHQKIEEHAEGTAENVMQGEGANSIVYPPNSGFTEAELNALDKLKGDENLKSGLRKLFTDHSAAVVFDLMNYLDGTSDPDPSLGEWTELTLVPRTADDQGPSEMLHDDFFSTYWDWEKMAQE